MPILRDHGQASGLNFFPALPCLKAQDGSDLGDVMPGALRSAVVFLAHPRCLPPITVF